MNALLIWTIIIIINHSYFWCFFFARKTLSSSIHILQIEVSRFWSCVAWSTFWSIAEQFWISLTQWMIWTFATWIPRSGGVSVEMYLTGKLVWPNIVKPLVFQDTLTFQDRVWFPILTKFQGILQGKKFASTFIRGSLCD